MDEAQQIIRLLKLEPLPREGGYFRETYRSPFTLPRSVLPSAYAGERQIGTSIYYLLTSDTFSAMHQLPGDEVFHFYLGEPVEMLQLHRDGSGNVVTIGNDIGSGFFPQIVVPGGSWQGSRLVSGGRYALLGTTMAPGFDFEDYTDSTRVDLTARYPKYSRLIAALTNE